MVGRVGGFFGGTLSRRALAQRERALAAALETVLERRAASAESRRAEQARELDGLLQFAAREVPFYREKYAKAGFRAAGFGGLEDLARVPLVTKEELRAAAPDELVAAGYSEPHRLLATSGSTGKPIRVFRDESSLARFSAANMAIYHDWCRGRPLANVLYFIDTAPGTIDLALADGLRVTVMEERIRSAFESLADQVEAVAELRPEFISSYPSTMRNVAAELARAGRTAPEVRLLHVTSEMLDGATRALIEHAFPNARIVESYTTTEAGLVGWQCLARPGFHVAEDGCLVEIVDEAGRPTEGLGRIVVTDLTSRATPIIRYAGLEDYARWDRRPCPCGSRLARIGALEGRFIDSITLAGGATCSPYTATNAMKEIAGITHFQILQDEPGKLAVRVVRAAGPGPAAAELTAAVQAALSAALGEAVAVELREVAEIAPPPGAHKVPLVVSRIRRGG